MSFSMLCWCGLAVWIIIFMMGTLGVIEAVFLFGRGLFSLLVVGGVIYFVLYQLAVMGRI